MHTWRHKLAALGLVGTRTGLLVLFLILAVAAAGRLDLRSDWSANRHFSLDPVLEEIIAEIDQDTRLVGIWPRQSSSERGRWHARIGDLVEPSLQLMARSSERLQWSHIDNEVDLPLLQNFREQHGNLASGAIYVVREGRRPFRIGLSGHLPHILQREVGGALSSMQRGDEPLVLVFQGHGELRPDGGNDHGLDSLLRQWELSGFRVRPIEAAQVEQLGRLPLDAIVVLAGPTNNLDRNMLEAIEPHLRDGGRMLVLGDHRLDQRLVQVLRRRGILINSGHPGADLGDPVQALQSETHHRPQLLYSEPYSTGRDGSFHRLILRPEVAFVEDPFAIMQQTRGSGRLVNSNLTVPVSILDPRYFPEQAAELQNALGQLGLPRMRASPLLFLPGEDSWIGPLAPRQNPSRGNPESDHGIAWAVEYDPDPRSSAEERRARVVVWGSRQAASDAVLAGDSYANAQLLSDMLGWLADRAEQTTIPAADFKAFRVDADDRTMTLLLALLVALIPCCCLGGAMIAWWERR